MEVTTGTNGTESAGERKGKVHWARGKKKRNELEHFWRSCKGKKSALDFIEGGRKRKGLSRTAGPARSSRWGYDFFTTAHVQRKVGQ